MTTQKTHKQLCVSEIQKIRMLGVFAPQDELVIYTPKIKRQGVKKNSFARPSIRLVDTKPNVGSLMHFLRTF